MNKGGILVVLAISLIAISIFALADEIAEDIIENDETAGEDMAIYEHLPNTENSDNTASQDTDDSQTNSNEEKITICHKPGTPAEKTMEIPEDALDGHLDHGDYVGECEEESNTEDTGNEEDDMNIITGDVVVDNEEDSGDDNPSDTSIYRIKLKAEAGPDQVVNEKTVVRFYGDSGFPDKANIMFKWDFGDGNIIEGANLKSTDHVYEKEGVYFVNLIVKKAIFHSEDSTAVDVNDVDN